MSLKKYFRAIKDRFCSIFGIKQKCGDVYVMKNQTRTQEEMDEWENRYKLKPKEELLILTVKLKREMHFKHQNIRIVRREVYHRPYYRNMLRGVTDYLTDIDLYLFHVNKYLREGKENE